MIWLTGKQSDRLAEAAMEGMKSLKSKVLTITLNNGLEFTDHKVTAKGLGADIYFAHPYASWQRGTNENTNGLLRHDFSKGIDWRAVSKETQ